MHQCRRVEQFHGSAEGNEFFLGGTQHISDEQAQGRSDAFASGSQQMLQRIKDDDVQIATADKDEVFRQDKTTLYRYRPTAKRSIGVPVLVAYGLIGRYTMTDLQEDRSLLRNLLGMGVDVYAVDWGSATRSDRWLTFEDYVDGYLNECVEFICREHGIEICL